jgi:hypothetical protein
VIITEVAFAVPASEGGDWVEIYNAGSMSVDISGYMLTDIDGTDTVFAASAVTLDPAEYAVIHWDSSGTDETDGTSDTNGNGYFDLYVSDTTLTATDDQLGLHDGSGYVDAVIWSDNDTTVGDTGIADFNILAPDQWNYADVDTVAEYNARSWINSDDIESGHSLARYLDPGTPVYADSNKKTDWYHETNPTPGEQTDKTLVELASFTATGHDDYVQVEWETASEIDNDGFNLWRSEAEAGSYTQLNADLIPARGGPTTGASYSYDDEAVTNGVTYWYKLEDVDLYGVSTFHGPVSAVAGRGYRLYLPLVLKGS